MDKVSIVKRQFRMEVWHKRISECQSSGVPVSHWCKQNGDCEQTYYKYLKRIREEMVDALPVSVIEQSKLVVFKRLEVNTPVLGTQAAVIIRLNGLLAGSFRDFKGSMRKMDNYSRPSVSYRRFHFQLLKCNRLFRGLHRNRKFLFSKCLCPEFS